MARRSSFWNFIWGILFVFLAAGALTMLFTRLNTCEHEWDAGTVAVEATCTSAGRIEYECELCGETKTKKISLLEHEVVVDGAVEATCTAPGATGIKFCAVCDTVIAESVEIPVLEHVVDEGMVVLDPKCTTDGSTRYGCINCGVFMYSEVVAATGHSWVMTYGYAATCAEFGLTDGEKCETCGTVSVAQETIPLAEHTFGDDEYCDICGLTYGMAYLQKFAVEGAYTETTVTGTEFAYGNVYRVYRPTEDGVGVNAYITSCTSTGGDVLRLCAWKKTNTAKYEVIFHPIDFLSIEGNFAYIVYEDYIDFYIASAKITMDDGILITYYIDESITIEGRTETNGVWGEGNALKRLTLIT